MNDVALAIEEARREVAKAAAQIFPDLFTLRIPGTSVPDGFGGTTESPTEHLNIPGKVEVLGRSDQLIGGALLTTQTHKITMGATSITKNIRSHYQLIQQAQGDNEAQTFENPVALFGSLDAFVKVAAALKR